MYEMCGCQKTVRPLESGQASDENRESERVRQRYREAHPGLTISSGKQTTPATPSKAEFCGAYKTKNEINKKKNKRAFRNPCDDHIYHHVRPYSNNRPRQIRASAPSATVYIYIYAIILMRIQ